MLVLFCKLMPGQKLLKDCFKNVTKMNTHEEKKNTLSVSLYLIIEKQVAVSLEWPINHLFKQDAMLWNYSWLSVRLQLQFVRKQTWLFLKGKHLRSLLA